MTMLCSYIDKLKDIRVLVIGDIMLDRFIYGKVDRISPEAPVPVFKFEREKCMLGGAGNVVANLCALGCTATYLGFVGRDENGKKIKSLLSDIGAKNHLLQLDNYPTIVKTRLIAGNNYLLRGDQEEMLPIIAEVLPRFKKLLKLFVQKCDIVLLSDYDKGLLTPITTQMIIDVCQEFDKKVIVDPKGNDYSKYAGADLVKPNLKEFSIATNRKYNVSDSNFKNQIIEGAKFLFEKYYIKNILVTLSEHGMIYVPSKNPSEVMQIPTDAKEVFDVSGAGDTAIATLTACIGSNVDIKDAIKLANIASGIVVSKLGTATVSAEELKSILSQRVSTETGWKQKRKLITLEQAISIIKTLREKGKKIGFTNGCFDCCHLGHLTSFMRARELCDVLVVGLNSDQWIKSHKGPDRPIQDEKTRALLLASMEFIDYIILFSDETPLPIIEKIRPDVIAKEGYSMDQWLEGQFVKNYGGNAVILKRVEGYSTSNLIKKIKGE